MLGLGGTRAEIYRDVVFRLAPVDQETVRRMAEGLKGRELFQGYRGAAPVKMDLLAEWLIRLGELACQIEAIQEIDVNPLLIVQGEPIAVDASFILR
jgi:acetyltransferase